MKPLAECRLYAFVDIAYLRGRAPEGIARQLVDGGADLIQLRAKGASVDEIRAMTERILSITQGAQVGLVVNDHPAIAAAAGAEACHLGQEDFFDAGFQRVEQVRGEAPGMSVGLSSHATEQAERAVAAGADYVAIGPVYATSTKPGAIPVTLDYVRWAAANIRIPWFAIGGINLRTLDAVLEAGARRVCVVSAILDAPDVAAACREFRNRLG